MREQSFDRNRLLFRSAGALEDVINIAFGGATGFYFAHAGIGVWPAVAQVTQVVRRGARGAWVFSLDHTKGIGFGV